MTKRQPHCRPLRQANGSALRLDSYLEFQLFVTSSITAVAVVYTHCEEEVTKSNHHVSKDLRVVGPSPREFILPKNRIWEEGGLLINSFSPLEKSEKSGVR
jgi:hypothetical protein